MQMRDLRMPVLPRWAVVVLVVVIALIVTFTLNALKESGSLDETAASSDGTTGSPSRDQVIDPLAPIDPDDKGSGELGKLKDGREKTVDLSDPFATGFGTSGRRKVTVRVSADGVANVGVSYRDGKRTQRAVIRTYTATRTVKGRFPMAALAIQLPGNLPGSANRATCTIVVDGVEVARKSTTEPGAVTVCVG
ncbi:MAG: hypothetical protein ACR2FE_09565 [Aeromicrobium sp.]